MLFIATENTAGRESRASGNSAAHRGWENCTTMHQLGDGPRPSITKWFRHLADIAPDVPERALSEA